MYSTLVCVRNILVRTSMYSNNMQYTSYLQFAFTLHWIWIYCLVVQTVVGATFQTFMKDFEFNLLIISTSSTPN